MRYYTNCGPVSGPALYRQLPGAIGVLEAPDNNVSVGLALGLGPDDGGIAVWELSVHGAAVPGRFIIINREFRPVP